MQFQATDMVADKSDSIPKYVVISPVRDEAEFIEKTIDSMTKQTITPSTWVIVNDGSKDGTELIVQEYSRAYPWIKLINRPDRKVRQRGKGVVEAFYAGFNTLEVNYDFVVKLDGDVSFGPDYFEGLLQKFASDPTLGIAGGGLYEKPDGQTWVLMTSKDHVRGCTKIYRQTCFTAIGGLVLSMGWDGIDEWKALSLGWKVQSFTEYPIYHFRFTGAATGYLKSFYEQGWGAYRMGYLPLYMIARGFWHMADRPYITGGLAMLWGYLKAWLQHEEMLADASVVRFVRQTQMKKLTGLLFGRPIHE